MVHSETDRYGRNRADFQAHQISKADGLARIARYRGLLTPPAGVGTKCSFNARTTTNLFCNTISMPGHDLQTSTVKHGTEINSERWL